MVRNSGPVTYQKCVPPIHSWPQGISSSTFSANVISTDLFHIKKERKITGTRLTVKSIWNLIWLHDKIPPPPSPGLKLTLKTRWRWTKNRGWKLEHYICRVPEDVSETGWHGTGSIACIAGHAPTNTRRIPKWLIPTKMPYGVRELTFT